MTTTRFCKDCKWARKAWLAPRSTFKCISPRNFSSINPVDGTIVLRYEYCSTLRLSDDDCGPHGEWWEPK